jgi:hypothetical protein
VVQQCPNCGELVGKLHLRCEWCGLYFCEDCIKPSKHYCSGYKQGLNDVENSTKKHTTVYSTEFYEKFASSDHLEEVKVQELSEREREEKNRTHIIKQNILYQQRLKSIILEHEKEETDPKGEKARYRQGKIEYKNEKTKKSTFSQSLCLNCGKIIEKVDVRCVWCGLHFCEACTPPESHNCSIYTEELEYYLKYLKPVEEIGELVKTHEQESGVDTSNDRTISVIHEQFKPLVELSNKNLENESPKVEAKEIK